MTYDLDHILATPKVTHALVQGSAEWDRFRLAHRGASEIAAVLGLSRTMNRTELLRAKHTGIAREFSDWLQSHILDKGHQVEALARPIVEVDIGEDLYPVTCSRGLLSASCDGLTMDGTIAFEHKQWNEDLAGMVRTGNVPDDHMPQCQQILLVTGAQKVRFVVSDGTPSRMVWAEVTPDRGWWERIVGGWAQFDADLATYVPQAPEAPKPTGRAPEALPALRIEVTGLVTASNLDAFKEHALAVIGGINRTLQTDEDFANAESTVKWCGDVETRLAAAKQHALSQTESIDALFRAIDEISAEARRVRLDLDKLVTRRKEEIKGEIVAATRAEYEQHIEVCKAETGGPWIVLAAPDFGGAIKGKRDLARMRDALATAVANGKIAADESARKIRAALAALAEETKGFEHLFADRLSFISKAPDDIRLLVRARIAEHQAKVQREADEAAEKARERIRKEEAEKLQREQEAAQQEELRREQESSEGPATTRHASLSPEGDLEHYEVPAPAANVRSMPQRAAAPASPPTLKLGEINARIAPLSIDTAGLARLGFPHAATDKSAKLYHEADFGRMCDSLVAHLRTVQQQRAAA